MYDLATRGTQKVAGEPLSLIEEKLIVIVTISVMMIITNIVVAIIPIIIIIGVIIPHLNITHIIPQDY